jgi:hypothetical protein
MPTKDHRPWLMAFGGILTGLSVLCFVLAFSASRIPVPLIRQYFALVLNGAASLGCLLAPIGCFAIIRGMFPSHRKTREERHTRNPHLSLRRKHRWRRRITVVGSIVVPFRVWMWCQDNGIHYVDLPATITIGAKYFSTIPVVMLTFALAPGLAGVLWCTMWCISWVRQSIHAHEHVRLKRRK